MCILAEAGGASFGSKASTETDGAPTAKIMGELRCDYEQADAQRAASTSSCATSSRTATRTRCSVARATSRRSSTRQSRSGTREQRFAAAACSADAVRRPCSIMQFRKKNIHKAMTTQAQAAGHGGVCQDTEKVWIEGAECPSPPEDCLPTQTAAIAPASRLKPLARLGGLVSFSPPFPRPDTSGVGC